MGNLTSVMKLSSWGEEDSKEGGSDDGESR